MDDSFQTNLENMAQDIRTQANDLKTDNLMSFFSAYDAVIRYVELEIARFNVSHSGFKILDALILNGGRMRPTDISEEISRSKHSITRVIDTLEKQGLVIRDSSGKDRRTKEVCITEEGLRICKIGFEAGRVSKEILGFLNEEESRNLSKLMKKIENIP